MAEKMSLISLPPDTLSEVTSFLSGNDLAHLWLCGSLGLQLNLGNRGAARQFSFRSHRHLWPSLVSQFHRLTFYSHSCNIPKREQPLSGLNNLHLLPVTLKTLKLDFTGSVNVWVDFFEQHPTQFPQLTSLSLSHYIFSSIGEDQPFNSPLWPDTLLSLDFCDKQTYLSTSLRLYASTLPKHLTSLRASIFTFVDGPKLNEGSGNVKEGEKFPSSLTHLNLVLVDAHLYWIDMLPSDLVSCVVNYNSIPPFMKHWRLKEKLPRLTVLQTFMTSIGDVGTIITKELLQQLPRSLTKLQLRKNAIGFDQNSLPSLLPHLPPSLTELYGMISNDIDTALVALLPRTLTILDSQVPLNALKFLPPTLTRANIKLDPLTVDHDLDSLELPNHRLSLPLRFLEISTANEKIMRLLPSSLTHLQVAEGIITSEAMTSIPRSVTRLSTMMGNPFLDDATFQNLPPYLDSMETKSVFNEELDDNGKREHILDLNPHSASWLPRHLRRLSLGIVCLPDASWFNDLPISLEHLHMDICLIAQKVTQQQSMPVNDGDVPRRIVVRSATIHYDRRPKEIQTFVYDWNMLHFPESTLLRTVILTFDFLPSRSDLIVIFQVLPPNLAHLRIGRRLVWVETGQKELLNEDLALLPRRLISLVLPPIASITAQGRQYLPKTLTKVSPTCLMAHP